MYTVLKVNDVIHLTVYILCNHNNIFSFKPIHRAVLAGRGKVSQMSPVHSPGAGRHVSVTVVILMEAWDYTEIGATFRTVVLCFAS